MTDEELDRAVNFRAARCFVEVAVAVTGRELGMARDTVPTRANAGPGSWQRRGKFRRVWYYKS